MLLTQFTAISSSQLASFIIPALFITISSVPKLDRANLNAAKNLNY